MERVRTTLTDHEYHPKQDFLRVATATPEVSLGDVESNVAAITELYEQAREADTSLVVFPELSITGYSIGDLVQSPALLRDTENALVRLAGQTEGTNTAMVVGAPIRIGNLLYNTAAMLADGHIKGIVPKQNLPTYKEFYEKRWYAAWEGDNTEVSIAGMDTTVGTDQLFTVAGSKVGIEVCEDLWVPDSPNVRLAANGATVIVNPSASPELASKRDYRRQLVAVTAGKLACAYLYSGADSSESTMDIVMSGHGLISEAGKLLAERQPFAVGDRLITADIDIAHLEFDRMLSTNYPNQRDMKTHGSDITAEQGDLLRRYNALPFVPGGSAEQRAERLDEVFTIQSTALAERLRRLGGAKLHLGLSGGLDSTLALLVAERAARRLGVNPGDIIETYTMPAKASSERTQSNAQKLADALGVPNTMIPISELSDAQLAAIDHSGEEDVTFQNTQARIRTAILFNQANQRGGLVLGTGDLSEIALGWCTFNGDHMSHYNVNASIPKTLVRHLVKHASESVNLAAQDVLTDILATPVSPELTGDGTLSQETESILGPYELHDFFLYHFIRFQDPADKISYIAKQTFDGVYTPEEIDTCLGIFISRFYGNGIAESTWRLAYAIGRTYGGQASACIN